MALRGQFIQEPEPLLSKRERHISINQKSGRSCFQQTAALFLAHLLAKLCHCWHSEEVMKGYFRPKAFTNTRQQPHSCERVPAQEKEIIFPSQLSKAKNLLPDFHHGAFDWITRRRLLSISTRQRYFFPGRRRQTTTISFPIWSQGNSLKDFKTRRDHK